MWDSYYANESDYGLALAALNKHSDHIIWPQYTPIPLEDRSMAAGKAKRDLKSEHLLNIYPNPTSNVTYFTYDREMKTEGILSIYDAKGRLVDRLATNESGITELNTKNWENGLYAIVLTYKGYQVAQNKLVKQ